MSPERLLQREQKLAQKAAEKAAKLAAKEEAKRLKLEAKIAAKEEAKRLKTEVKEAAKKLAAEQKAAQKLFDCPIPHKNCAEIVEMLVLPEYLKNGSFSTWGMELRTFKMIVKKGYKNEQFWRQFNPGFQVKSMLYWLNSGANSLERAWRFYQYEKEQNKAFEESRKMVEAMKVVDSGADLDTVESVKPKKPRNAIEWAS